MKILVLLTVCFLFNSVINAQNLKTSSDEKILLKVTTELKGMSYSCETDYTLYSDGRPENGNCGKTTQTNEDKKNVPIGKSFNAKFLAEFIQFIEESGFLEAEKEYRGKKTYTDIFTVTTIVYRNKNSEKKVTVINYDPYDSSIPCFVHRLMLSRPFPN